MIAALDSAQPPTGDQAAQALLAGVRGWWGYIATTGQGGSAFNLLHVWTETDFDVVRHTFGAPPIAYGSGWDDPVALRQLADVWGVRLGLDLESRIRGDGSWVQPWLDASGAGLYGSCGIHYHSAAWHVLAWYPGFDPGGTWYGPCGTPPAGPVGLQWQGSHQEFGLDVDRGWYDDFFGATLGGQTDMAITRHPTLQRADIFWPGPSGVQHRTYNGVSGAPTGAPDGWLLNSLQHSEGLGGDPVQVLGACWIDGRYLHVVIVDRTTGNLQVREFDLQVGWTPDWVVVPDQAADLSRITGPAGPPGLPGQPGPATYVNHRHNAQTDTGAPI